MAIKLGTTARINPGELSKLIKPMQKHGLDSPLDDLRAAAVKVLQRSKAGKLKDPLPLLKQLLQPLSSEETHKIYLSLNKTQKERFIRIINRDLKGFSPDGIPEWLVRFTDSDFKDFATSALGEGSLKRAQELKQKYPNLPVYLSDARENAWKAWWNFKNNGVPKETKKDVDSFFNRMGIKEVTPETLLSAAPWLAMEFPHEEISQVLAEINVSLKAMKLVWERSLAYGLKPEWIENLPLKGYDIIFELNDLTEKVSIPEENLSDGKLLAISNKETKPDIPRLLR